MVGKLSIRKTTDKLSLNKNIVFSIHRKVLNALSIFRKNTKLSGKVQNDEKYESLISLNSSLFILNIKI